MKRIVYLLITATFFGSCSTTTKTTTASTLKLVQPADVTFTKVENLEAFKTIYMPFEGNDFGRRDNDSYKNDAGENIPSIKHNGYHVYLRSDLSEMKDVGNIGTDIELALEKVKKTYYLKILLKNENTQQEYTDVTIAGKKVKKFKLIKPGGNGSYLTFTIGYIFPHNKTTGMILVDKEVTDSKDSEIKIKQIEEAFEYMIASAEFREFSK